MSDNRGEIEVRQVLDECCDRNDWKVWYNRKLKNDKYETDAIVLTEKALFVIEVKNLFGKISPDGFGHWILRNLQNRAVKVKSGWYQVLRQVDTLKNTLSNWLKGRKNPPVFPIVVLNNEDCDASMLMKFDRNCIIKKSQIEITLHNIGRMLEKTVNQAAVARVVSKLPVAC